MTAAAWVPVVDAFKEHLRTEPSRRGGKPGAPRKMETRKMYVQHVRWLSEGVTTGPWEVTASELAKFLGQQNWSVATTKNVLISLRTFYAWGVANQWLDWAPTAGVQSAARRPGPLARPWQPAWAEPIQAFVQALRSAGRSENTIIDYGHRLRLLSEVAADPWAVTTEQLEEWLSNPDWSPQTRRNRRTAAASFYKWAERRGRVEVSPATDLAQVSVPRALPRPAPHDVIREALAAADDRTRLALLLAVDAGLRRAEIAGLHASQVASTHLLVVGKGGRQRVVPIDPAGDLAVALRVELERRRRGGHGTGWSGPFVKENGYLFPTDKHPGPMKPQRIGNLVSRALGEHWTAHPLRHRFATDAYAAERDIQAVQQLLGHARPETTAVYAQVPDGALLAAVRAAGAGRRLA